MLPGPLENITRPTGIYTNLGTTSDNPRSVAICPQRKCVAFGCRNGIELHWVDQITGTSLNRWFPLAAPSDQLHFLPQRTDAESTKKLRLISSAGGPQSMQSRHHDSDPTRWKFRSSSTRYGRMQSMTRLFYGALPFPNALSRRNSTTMTDENDRQGVLRTVDCDHYMAVPISDGTHILFTDPATGLLCLGSDAPLGGPTKLMRKVAMVPPASDCPESATALVCYRAGHEVRWGIRIVAAYEDGRIMLYNVPVDCFERIRTVRAAASVWDEMAGVVGQSDLLMDVFMANEQESSSPDDHTDGGALEGQSSDSSIYSKSFRSLQIDGAVIYHTTSPVEDIQVDSGGGGVRVWLFLRDSPAVRLSIYAPRHFRPTKRYVGVDGLVRNAESPVAQNDAVDESGGSKGKQSAHIFDNLLDEANEDKDV